jgi:hypothetical protein
MSNSFSTYIDKINKVYLLEDRTEHTHRPILKKIRGSKISKKIKLSSVDYLRELN